MSAAGNGRAPASSFDAWLTRLEARHLSDLQVTEVARALRALSSTYVERRETALRAHHALEGTGKRAAFALYYGPLHYLALRRVLLDLGAEPRAAALPIVDIGCGTGAAGAAVAVASRALTVHGIDTHPWALAEARDTYRHFGLDGSTSRGGAARLRLPRRPTRLVAAYVVNELPDAERAALERTLVDAVRHGSHLLMVEPLARRAAPWWSEWVRLFTPLGARADEWKLTLDPPPLVARLGEAAGLTPGQVNLRTLMT